MSADDPGAPAVSVAARFGFRPWVRRSCRRALGWGLGVVALLAGLAWVLRTPGTAPVARAFGVLMAYGLLFLATLAKIWWTAGAAAVVLSGEALAYQPLHGLRPRRLALATVLGCAPREGTQALRFVYSGRRHEEREFYLNLGVVDDRHEFLARLGDRLAAAGLVALPGRSDAWARPGWAAW